MHRPHSSGIAAPFGFNCNCTGQLRCHTVSLGKHAPTMNRTLKPCLRAKHMGSADCAATRLLARRFCEPRRALRTSTKGNEVHEATTGGCTKGSAKAQAPHEPTGFRESQAPARTHANSKLLATQSGDPFCFALKQCYRGILKIRIRTNSRTKTLAQRAHRPGSPSWFLAPHYEVLGALSFCNAPKTTRSLSHGQGPTSPVPLRLRQHRVKNDPKAPEIDALVVLAIKNLAL